MNVVDTRIRVAILWVAWFAASAFALLLWLLVEPTALEEALAGEMDGFASDGGVGYYMAIFAVIPLGLAVMTLQLDNRGTRYVNLIAGLLIGAWGIVEMVGHLVDGEFNASVLVSVAATLIAFLIAGLSVAELRKPVPPPTATAVEQTKLRETTTV